MDHGQLPHKHGMTFPQLIILFFLVLRRWGLLLDLLLLLQPSRGSLVICVRATISISLVLTHAAAWTTLQVLILDPI